MSTTLVVITGPTGVGKTELCIRLAERFHTDIINADSRQIFREIPIGTAAPTAEQQARVKHHFVGTHSITDYYSASMYEQDVMKLLDSKFHSIHEIPSGGEIPSLFGEGSGERLSLMTGGSMMYIDAVCNGIDDIPTIRDDIRQEMKRRYEEEGLAALVEDFDRLFTIGHCLVPVLLVETADGFLVILVADEAEDGVVTLGILFVGVEFLAAQGGVFALDEPVGVEVLVLGFGLVCFAADLAVDEACIVPGLGIVAGLLVFAGGIDKFFSFV